MYSNAIKVDGFVIVCDSINDKLVALRKIAELHNARLTAEMDERKALLSFIKENEG